MSLKIKHEICTSWPTQYSQGKFRVEKPYKSGANGWAVPSTTEHPEDVVKLADFLASREGKLLGQYGIKGRDYTLDKKATHTSNQKY